MSKVAKNMKKTFKVIKFHSRQSSFSNASQAFQRAQICPQDLVNFNIVGVRENATWFN